MTSALTVLMPVYNAAKHLREATESILNQSFSNFEFLIIDDASTDDSVEIIKSYKDPRIRLVVNEQNLGISATLNKGIEMSSTELIARMDSDDMSYSERLQKQYDYFQKYPDTVLLSTSVRMIAADDSPIEDVQVTHNYNCYNLNFICAQFHPTIMYKRSVILSYGGYTVRYSEDFDLWWRLMAGNNRIGHIDEMLLDYRRSEKSLSAVVRKKEYNEASHELLLRNLRYYAGLDYQLTYNEAECLQHRYEPLLQKKSVGEIVTCLKKLAFINEKIYSRQNVNYTRADLEPYANIKRDYIIYYFYVRLPRYKAILLLLRTQSLPQILNRLKKSIVKK